MKYTIRLLAVALLSACAAIYPNLPPPAVSDYFSTLGGGFTIRVGSALEYRYGINLVSRTKLSPSNYIEVEYQNPGGSNPFVLSGDISTLETSEVVTNSITYIFRSPPVKGIKQHTNYLIVVRLYENSSKELLLGTHEQLVNSEYNQN